MTDFGKLDMANKYKLVMIRLRPLSYQEEQKPLDMNDFSRLEVAPTVR
jgi:hypothetical protein